MAQRLYDVVVIGSGMGGLCAGALLANKGYRTLLVEKLPRVGGRFSTVEYEGFKLPTGAVAVEAGGVIEGIFKEVGADFNIHDVSKFYCWMKGQWFPLPEKSQIRALFDMLGKTEVGRTKLMAQLAKETALTRISNAFKRAASTEEGIREQRSFRDWLMQYTDDPEVIQLFHSLTSGMSTVNDFEYPAAHWFAYISKKGMGGFYKFGLAPNGNVQVAESLAAVIIRKGGDVWTNTPVKRILVQGGQVAGVIVERDGSEVEVAALAVISNAGPVKTVELAGSANFATGYLDEMKAKIRPAPIVATYVASDRPLVDLQGFLMMVGLRRIVSGVCMSLTCPELAPPRQHLTVLWGTPASCLHHVDRDAETEQNMLDIKQLFPDFEKHGRILKMDIRDIDDGFPAHRTWPGYDLPQLTPVPNLFNVGDGVKPLGWVGMPSCAKSARLVVEELTKRIRPGDDTFSKR